jgi:asparagine synthase (glutamine-hydrolysing)
MNRLDEPIFGHLPRWHTTRKICRFLDAGVRESMQMPGDFDDLKVLLPDGVEKWEPLSRTQYIEAQTLLSGYILSSQGDRVAMAHSVEGRYPFLDNAVVDYATTLPARLKIRGLAEKYVLKESVRDLVPARILDRPKQPYRAPEIASFIRDGDPLDYVAELFSPSRLALAGYFDSQAAGKLFEKCRRGLAKGAVDNMAFVGILSTMLLDDLYIRDSGGMFTASISKNTYVAAR